VQRDSGNRGSFRITGALPLSADQIFVSVLGTAQEPILINAGLDCLLEANSFDCQTPPLSAGGWYTLIVEAKRARDSRVLAQAQVSKIGIGEIFLTAGQSNSVNSGVATGFPSPPRVSTLNPASGEWRQAAEPMPFAQAGGSSIWPWFGHYLSELLNVPVAIITAGCGGTTLDDWQPNRAKSDSWPSARAQNCVGESYHFRLFDRLKEAAQLLIRNYGGMRAILWHQGESDTLQKTGTDAYFAGFRTLRQTMHSDVERSLTWVTANASFVPNDWSISPPPVWSEDYACLASTITNPASFSFWSDMLPVRSAQQMLWERNLTLQGPDTDALVGPRFRSGLHGGACIHFSARGIEAHAAGWLSAILQRLLPTDSIPIFHGSSGAPEMHVYSPIFEEASRLGYSDLAFFIFRIRPQEVDTIPLYHCRNGTLDFLSLSQQCNGKVFKGLFGYISKQDGPGLAPLYSLRRAGVPDGHRVTARPEELERALSQGWTNLGILGYVRRTP